MRVPKCPTCGGNGQMRIEGNPDAFTIPSDQDYDHKAQPGQPCDDCAGTGKDLNFSVHPHAHHVNPKAKENWI